MIVVASSLSLLAIVAGMLLYAKTIKDGLNLFFKIIALFIIIVGFINLFAGSAVLLIEKVYTTKMNHRKMESKLCKTCGGKLKNHACKIKSCRNKCREKSCYQMDSYNSNEICSMDNEHCSSSMMDEKSLRIHSMMMKKDSIMKNK